MIRDETVLLTNLVTCCSRFAIFPRRSSRPGSSLQKEKKCFKLLNCLSSFLLYSLADEKKNQYNQYGVRVYTSACAGHLSKNKCKLTTPSAPFIPGMPSLPGAPGSPIGPLSPWNIKPRSLIKVELIEM